MQERLQKILSQAGIASRRESEKIITDGRVTVGRAVVTELGTKADPETDTITVDGKPLKVEEQRVYILLYKPVGYMTTMKDPEGRPIVTDLLEGVKERVYPIGRLDYNTEGLLLLTNDGALANTLMHPSHEVDKGYLVRVSGHVSPDQIRSLAEGVKLEDGMTAPAKVVPVSERAQLLDLHHHPRGALPAGAADGCEAVGLSVVRLKRARYDFLQIGDMKPGEFRLLQPEEVTRLRRSRCRFRRGPVEERQGGEAAAPEASLFQLPPRQSHVFDRQSAKLPATKKPPFGGFRHFRAGSYISGAHALLLGGPGGFRRAFFSATLGGQLLCRTARALARLSASPFSWAILLRASEKLRAVSAWLLGMPNCFLYSPGFRPCTCARWRASVFMPLLPQSMQLTLVGLEGLSSRKWRAPSSRPFSAPSPVSTSNFCRATWTFCSSRSRSSPDISVTDACEETMLAVNSSSDDAIFCSSFHFFKLQTLIFYY